MIGTTARPRSADALLFFRTWLRAPLKTAAYAPSSHSVARMMAAAARIGDDGPVVELGAGTGALTAGLVEGGVDPARLVLLEYDADFAAVLRSRYPTAQVIQGDAYAAPALLGEIGAAAIVSGLPLVQYADRARFVFDCLGVLGRPGARFAQLSYMVTSPVPLSRLPGVSHAVSPTVWANFPPARIWSYWIDGQDA